MADHVISLRLSDGQLAIWIDGTLANAAPMSGLLRNTAEADLCLGGSRGRAGFEGRLLDLRLWADSGPRAASETPIDLHRASHPRSVGLAHDGLSRSNLSAKGVDAEDLADNGLGDRFEFLCSA